MASGRVDGDGGAANDAVPIVTEENDVDISRDAAGVVEQTVEGPKFGGPLSAVAGSEGGVGRRDGVLHEVLHLLSAGEGEGSVGHQGHVHSPGVDDGVGGSQS